MLVLSRKIGQRIVIDESITLIVQRVNGNRVTLGIEAPRDVDIVRAELRSDWLPVEEEVSTAQP